ncbi:MAG: AAA family ATPase, partial [Anaerolineales bacterium]
IESAWPGPEGQECAQLAAQRFGFMSQAAQPIETTQDPGALTRAHNTLRELIARLAKIRPFALVVDDLHWIDRNSLQLLTHIVEKDLKPLQLFVLAAARPDFIRENPQWRNKASLVPLGPLPIQAESVLAAYPDLAGLPEELLTELAQRSEGNPYFLEQIVKALHKTGFEEIARAPHETLAKLNASMPESIRAALQARLDNLPRDARTVALLASVCGRTFWVGSILAAARATTGTGTLASMPPPVIERLVQDGLRQLVRSELVAPRTSDSEYEPMQEYIFKNTFLSDVAYNLIPVRNRAMYHRAVGQWLADQDDFHFKLLAAGHFEQGGAFGDAAIQYEEAAAIARKRRTAAEAQALQESATLAREKARENARSTYG